MNLYISSIDNKKDFMAKYSPINYVKKDLPKMLIIDSENDTMVPYSNSLPLYTKSKKFSLVGFKKTNQFVIYEHIYYN